MEPHEALNHAHHATTKVHKAGRWRITGWWIIATYFGFTIITLHYLPRFNDDWSLAIVAAVAALLALLAIRAKVFDTHTAKIENRYIAATIAAGLTCAALSKWAIPEGPTPWAYPIAAIPLAVCAAFTIHTWRTT